MDENVKQQVLSNTSAINQILENSKTFAQLTVLERDLVNTDLFVLEDASGFKFSCTSDQLKLIIDGLQVYSGTSTPDLTPPASFKVGDFYKQVIPPSTTVLSFWQYNGSVWSQIQNTAGIAIENEYNDIAELLADQINQTTGLIQFVLDATTDPTVDDGYAYYEKLSTSTGILIDDYRKFSDEEIQIIISGTFDNIISIKTILNTDLTTVDADGLATYYNALDPFVIKRGYESWRINIVDVGDAVLKTFDLVNRGKGLIGLDSDLPELEASNFFEINVGSVDELTTDELAAVQGANTPSGANVFATIADLEIKQTVQSGNFVLTVTDNDATVSMDGGTCTIDPNTQAYQDAFVVAMKNITDSTDGSIVCTAATGWTYKVNDNAAVASGTFTFPAGATCTIIKFEGTNKIYIDGVVE
jgi:hypothetical protein